MSFPVCYVAHCIFGITARERLVRLFAYNNRVDFAGLQLDTPAPTHIATCAQALAWFDRCLPVLNGLCITRPDNKTWLLGQTSRWLCGMWPLVGLFVVDVPDDVTTYAGIVLANVTAGPHPGLQASVRIILCTWSCATCVTYRECVNRNVLHVSSIITQALCSWPLCFVCPGVASHRGPGGLGGEPDVLHRFVRRQ